MSNNPSETSTASQSPRGLAVTALIAGLGSLLLVLLYLLTDTGALFLIVGLLLGLVGVILGIIALKRRQAKGMALTGLVSGAISVLIAIGLIVFALIFIGAFMSESPYL